MKTWIATLTLLLLTQAATAHEKVVQSKNYKGNWGTVNVTVTDVGEPVDLPLRITIIVKCRNGHVYPDGASHEALPVNRLSCKFWGSGNLNGNEDIVYARFSEGTYDEKTGVAQCNPRVGVQSTVTVSEICGT